MNTNTPEAVSERKKWLIASLLSFLYIVPALFYIKYAHTASTGLMAISFIAASTASLLFATALSLGSISHFTGWPNMRSGYQKQIGILAFWYSLFYCITLLSLYPEVYGYGFFSNFFSADIILGGIAMIIFAAMVLVNSKFITPHIPRETIGFVLGLGYIGYALLVIRAILLEFPLWSLWFETFSGLPPGRLMLSAIALVVLILRVVVAIHKHRRSALVTQQSTAPTLKG